MPGNTAAGTMPRRPAGMRWVRFILLPGLILPALLLFQARQRGMARRGSTAVLTRLQAGLAASDPGTLLDTMAMPAAIDGRSAPEQVQFLRKALLDELSAEGLSALAQHGRFGRLKKLFPAEAEAWAKQAGVASADCFAFRMERNGRRAEVVLVELSLPEPAAKSQYRIVRLNNVRQMADAYP